MRGAILSDVHANYPALEAVLADIDWRRGDPRACYLLLEVAALDAAGPESVRAEFIRVPYDVERAANAIVDSPLPDEFAAMLHQAH